MAIRSQLKKKKIKEKKMVFFLHLLNSVVDFALCGRKPTSFLNKTQPPSCKVTVREASYTAKGMEMSENRFFFSEISNIHSPIDSKISVECHCVPSTVLRIPC